MFFDRPDYDLASAAPGSYALTPTKGMVDALRKDSDNTVAMIFGQPPKFEAVLELIHEIEKTINRADP